MLATGGPDIKLLLSNYLVMSKLAVEEGAMLDGLRYAKDDKKNAVLYTQAY